MKRILLALIVFSIIGGISAFAADLTIEWQLNTAKEDYKNNFFTFSGGVNSVEKDQFDAAAGASMHMSTDVFNSYRRDVLGKKVIPVGVRYLFLYAVANDDTRVGDNLTVDESRGVITVDFVHRGTAVRIVTDNKGRLTLPGGTVLNRKIGTTRNLIHKDFSPTGEAKDIDWNKVWDKSIAGGKAIDDSTKTGSVVEDTAESNLFAYEGVIQYDLGKGFSPNVMTATAELNVVKK